MNNTQNIISLENAYSALSGGVPRWKRVLDIALVLMAMPLLIPLMVLIAVLIRIVSTGPVLFKQERVGCSRERFMCFKFRTMIVGADTAVHQGHLQRLMDSNLPMVKMDARGDSRLIPFGLLLRSTGLDELPQIINVLRGEMSIVGPRPCVLYEYDKYLPWQRERFNTLPGLTGLWQVSGKNRTTFTEMVRLDIDYVRNKTLWLDIKIILKTVPALLIQILDLRKRRQSGAGNLPSATGIPAGADRQPSLPQTAFSEKFSSQSDRHLNPEVNIKNGVAI